MILRLHKNARTTPAVRAELRAVPASVSTNALAKRYGHHHKTVDKWR
jgi:hypothetical protein